MPERVTHVEPQPHTPPSQSASRTEAIAKLPRQHPLTLVMRTKSAEDAKKLRALVERLQGQPHDKNPVRVALDHLKTVHFARFVFLDKDKSLAVITTYDGDFEDYINQFVDQIGKVFDQILAHIKGAPPLPVKKHRREFLDYVRAHDLPCVGTFYSAYPEANVLEIQAAVARNVT